MLSTPRFCQNLPRQLFETVKGLRGLDTLISQCTVISGDVTEPELAISPEDRQLITEKVSIIYHCAATIRFDETLKKAVMLNTRGTKYMIDLAKQCKKLDVSTGGAVTGTFEAGYQS